MAMLGGYQWRKTLRLCNSHVSLIIKSFSSSNKKHLETEGSRFTMSYLINSRGFSLETAKSLSEKVTLKNPKNPDSVIQLLKKNGFTNTQINNLITTSPDVLLVNPDKRLLPKLEFFKSVGMSIDELADLLSSSARIWSRSLQNKIIPAYNLLKKMLIRDSKVVSVLKRPLSFIFQNYESITPNILTLQRLGVPESSIFYLLTWHPNTLCKASARFGNNVKKVTEMGCDPLRKGFVVALVPACGMNEKSWSHKFDVYMKLGWSEDELRSVFRRYPLCLSLSEENITRKMDFLVRKMGWTPADVARAPATLGYNIDKRIIPRCSVVKALLMRGLIKKKPGLSLLLAPSDDKFLDRFVLRHCNESGELLDIFEGRVKPFVLGSGSEGIS